MSALPSGWEVVLIGDVCKVVGGSTPKTTMDENWDGDIPWITPNDLSNYNGKFISRGERSITRAGFDSCSTTLMPAGSVLYSSRAPIGYAVIAANPVCTNQGFKSFVPSDRVTSDYLYWYLCFATPDIRKMGSGTTFSEISGKVAKSIPLVLAPLDEQQRIVEVIEEQFSRLDAGVGSLQRAKRNLTRLRASILKAGVEGELVGRDENHWDRATIGDIAQVGSGATPKKGERRYWEGGTVPWVTSGQLNTPFVVEPAAFVTEAALKETSVRLWPAGTLLVAMYGEGKTRGKCSELSFPSTANQACAGILLDAGSEYLKPFLKLVLTARYEENRRLASGGVQPNLSLGLIKSMEVPLPSKEDQRRIVAEVDRQFSILAALGNTVDAGLRRASMFRRSVLCDAFAGRLTKAVLE
jgi:type I restriction enzyme S subunit